MNFSFLAGKRLAIFLHIAAWAVLFILPIYVFNFDNSRDIFFIYRTYIRTIIYVLIFYLNFFWLIPKILFKGKTFAYYLIALLVIGSLYFAYNSINNYIFERPEFGPEREMIYKIVKEYKLNRQPQQFDIFNFLMTTVLITGFSIGLRMLGRYNENEKQRKDLEKERLNSELIFLKNQISPHFFFNTLNNIYSLIEINTVDAQKAVLQLSKMMRYMLYESEHGNILLSKEIEFMKNYIELMKLRLTDKVQLQVNFPDKNTDIPIPPLLFIPFIENAFKHGVSNRESSFLNISMRVDLDEILFLCNNSLVLKGEVTSSADSGIGLENVQKRLSLLFKNKHHLTINKTETAFEVALQIERN